MFLHLGTQIFQEIVVDNNDDIRILHCLNRTREIQAHLNDCRDERRPYLFITQTMRDKYQSVSSLESLLSPSANGMSLLRRILVPVSMLEEEVYKAEICTYLARKAHAHLILLQANDYGSKAQQNVNRIRTHIEGVSQRIGQPLSYEIQKAFKNSFGLTKEASERQRDFGHDLLLLTASREYGIDDYLFGPPERKAIQYSLVPVMLVNPREDLFSLCD